MNLHTVRRTLSEAINLIESGRIGAILGHISEAPGDDPVQEYADEILARVKKITGDKDAVVVPIGGGFKIDSACSDMETAGKVVGEFFGNDFATYYDSDAGTVSVTPTREHVTSVIGEGAEKPSMLKLSRELKALPDGGSVLYGVDVEKVQPPKGVKPGLRPDLASLYSLGGKKELELMAASKFLLSLISEARKAPKKPAGLPPIDSEDYPPIKGMEGPFRFKSGKILYYDPKEGRYYDRKTDIYQDRDVDPMNEANGGGVTGLTPQEVWDLYVKACKDENVRAMTSWYDEAVAKGIWKHALDTAMMTSGRSAPPKVPMDK